MHRDAIHALVALFSLPLMSVCLSTTTLTTTITSVTTSRTTTLIFSPTTTLEAVISGSVTAFLHGTSTQSADAAMAYSGAAFQSAVLNSTNHYRSSHLANAVTWNDSLAEYAQNHAQKCLWQHSGGPNGENLAENYASPTLAIDAWANEEHKYNYAHPKFSEATGHFTQLVWKNTTSVGCGAVQCDNTADNGANGWLLVCEYYPPGNVAPFYKYMVQKPGIGKDGRLGFGSGAASWQSGDDGGARSMKAMAALVAVLACLI